MLNLEKKKRITLKAEIYRISKSFFFFEKKIISTLGEFVSIEHLFLFMFHVLVLNIIWMETKIIFHH